MQRIFLTGYMGAGKTTLGKMLATQSGLSFIDLDIYIEARYRKTVRDLFTEQGEEGFRTIERRMLREVADFEDVVVSTGGGTPCFFDNMEVMKACGITVYLKASVEHIIRRIGQYKHTRPILKGLTGDALKAFVETSLEERRSCYEQAHIVFDADKLDSAAEIAQSAELLQRTIARYIEQTRY